MKNFQPISSFDDDSTEETSEGTSPKIIRARCRNAFNNARIKAWKRKDSKYTQLFRTFAYEDIEGPVLGGNDTDTDYDDHDEEIEDAVPQGTIPHLNTNIRHKAVTISYSHPQFFVEGEDMNANFAVQELFKRLWEYNGWRKRTRKASLKSFISGTGICAVLWNQERGVVVENITPKDFLFDPYLLDFDNLRWAARRFMMPAEEALELYPKLSEYMKNDEEIEDDGSKASMVTLWCYWDQQTEAILYEWNVLKSEPNAYGDVPIEVYENEDDPDNAYATGDYDSCLGLQSQHTMMMDALNEQGRNGGSFTMINSNILSAKDRENLETGQLSALIAVEGLPEESIYRVPASPINPAQQFSIQAMERAIDGRTGVTPESRGQPDPNAKFATQVAIANKMQGAVGQDQSAGFERFVNCIINRALDRKSTRLNSSHSSVSRMPSSA